MRGGLALFSGLAVVAAACGGLPSSGAPSAPASAVARATATPPPASSETQQPLPASTPVPASGVDGRTWSAPVPLPRRGTNGAVEAVAAGPAGWVAVGTVLQYDDAGDGDVRFAWQSGIAWTSPDGVTWTAVQDGGAFAGASMYGIAWTSQGFIAVGNVKDERPDPVDAHATHVLSIEPAAWRSRDGTAWARIAVEGVATDGVDGGRLNDIVEVGGQLVAVGCLDEQCLFGPAMWVAGPAGAFEPLADADVRPSAAASAVLSTSGGLLAVGGYNWVGNEAPRAAVWSSTDGRSWERVEGIEGGEAAVMYDVARSGELLIAVGSTYRADEPGGDLNRSVAAAWRSDDGGRTWTATGGGTIGAGAGVSLDSVVHTGQAFVAVGRLADDERWRPIGWTSTDGIEWEAIELPAHGGAPVALADGPGGVVAVGGHFGPWVGEDAPDPLPDILAWSTTR